MISFIALDGSRVLVAEEFFTARQEMDLIDRAALDAREGLRREFQRIRDQEVLWNAAATLEQTQIDYGDYFAREWADPMGGPTVHIYGRVMPLDELWRRERLRGAPDDEIHSVTEWIEDGYDRGWRWGRCHSVIEPQGEYGGTHVATMRKIGLSEFNKARNNDWQPVTGGTGWTALGSSLTR